MVASTLKECFEVPTQKTIDSDMGEYLPDEMGDSNDINGETKGTDKLKIKQKIAESRPITIISKSIEAARKTKGKKVKARPGNREKNPNPLPRPYVPVSVDPKQSGEEVGIGKGTGKKTISFPKVIGQRTIPRNPAHGIYGVRLKTEKSSDTIYLTFSSVGEDNKHEELIVNTYVANDIKHQNVKSTKIGPIKVTGNEFNDFSIILDCSEKIMINMTVTDER